MISFTVRMRFPEEDRGEITSVLAELATASRKEAGCESYVPHWVDGEPATVLIYEQYQDEAAADHHRSTEHFSRYATGVLYQKMLNRQVEHLQAIA